MPVVPDEEGNSGYLAILSQVVGWFSVSESYSAQHLRRSVVFMFAKKTEFFMVSYPRVLGIRFRVLGRQYNFSFQCEQFY